MHTDVRAARAVNPPRLSALTQALLELQASLGPSDVLPESEFDDGDEPDRDTIPAPPPFL